ncbi:MAG: hypothetical protein E6K82_01440 [Candidatus Rokuibacteriota bacterium]|nr:MAG: hypothetical protein E6K82_01440 [Candidatus Rokubacteria bacterium]
MYAHVNVWCLTDQGAAWKDDAACTVAAALQSQPGFRSYTLVRTGEWEVVAITVFESKAELDAALAAIAPLVREAVTPLAEGVIERRAGAVLFHVTAYMGGHEMAPQAPRTFGASRHSRDAPR